MRKRCKLLRQVASQDERGKRQVTHSALGKMVESGLTFRIAPQLLPPQLGSLVLPP